MYTALYRAYRPETFNEVLGQEHIIKILRNQINNNSTGHAYLFCGTRGTGKTTTARLLAKGVNCTSENLRPCGVCDNCKAIKDGTFMDVIEIDAASNNGVENIRELRESVKYPPVLGRKKVYIIDEVHMLSLGASNALLKTLEEPPENVIFILATTEPQKLLATILSRCLKLDFRRVTEKILQEGMKKICSDMNINITDGALALVAANADGSVRDGLSILDQCLSAGTKDISREDILDILGTAGEEIFLEITDAVMRHNVAEALLLLDRVLADGKDVRQFMKGWMIHYRNLLITKFVNKAEDLLNMSCENIERIGIQSQRLDVIEINNYIIELAKTIADAKWSTQPRILLELCIVKMATGMLQKNTAVLAPEATEDKAAISDKSNSQMQGTKKKQDESEANRTLIMQEDNEVDKDKLWHEIFEKGEDAKASFNLIREGTELAEVTDDTFLVFASSEIKAECVNKKQRELEDIMEQHTGVRRQLICKVKSSGDEDSKCEEDIDSIKKNAENRLGINIELV